MSLPRFHRLIQDDDGHWYVIPTSAITAFYRWVAAGPYWEGYDGPVFDNSRVDGPQSVAFTDYAVSENQE
jgi:hypothetical protein